MKPNPLLAVINEFINPGLDINVGTTIRLRRKNKVKSDITNHKPRPGRGHPAKGYDPITKTWSK